MESCVDWFTYAQPDIYYISCRNAVLHGRFYVTKQDILIAIKRYKFGYDGFRPPPIVLSVYDSVMKSEEKKVYNRRLTR